MRTKAPKDNRWRQVKYMVFDMPDARLPFEERYKNYSNLIAQINAEHIRPVKQQRFHSNHELSEHLKAMVEDGAEGLMLHLATALHQSGRSDALLKLKPYFDEEAEVIAHLPGKGKYTDMLHFLISKKYQIVDYENSDTLTEGKIVFQKALNFE